MNYRFYALSRFQSSSETLEMKFQFQQLSQLSRSGVTDFLPLPCQALLTLEQGWQKKIICDQELQITVLCSNLRRKLATVQINLQVVDCSVAEMFHSVSLLQG